MKKLSVAECVLAIVTSFVLAALVSPAQAGKPAKAKPDAAQKGRPAVFTNTVGMKFVLIPAGSFMMGSRPGEAGLDTEHPRHRVEISRQFYMQTTEVTQGQWRAVMGQNPSSNQCRKPCHTRQCRIACDARPVERVSWFDAQKFIERLNSREKTDKYRLPTEAEWEYACRAGTNTAFAFGEKLAPNQANFDYREEPLYGPERMLKIHTTRVGRFPPNRWGLYDMHGNVEEWCQDWFDPHYYDYSPSRDPRGPASGKNKVARGGVFENDAWSLRSAHRSWEDPSFTRYYLGFRVVREY